MKIGDLNVRVFALTVQELPDRTEWITNHLKERGIEFECYNCFSSAVSGLRTIHPYEYDNPGSGWNVGPYVVANWLSQYSLWQAMSFMPEDYFLQLEYDSLFVPEWRARTEKAIADTPKDFDILYLGSCCAADKRTKNHVAGEVWDVRYPLCSHGMLIAKKALPVMLRTQRKVYACMDISLSFHTMAELKVFTVLPRIISQWNTTLVD